MTSSATYTAPFTYDAGETYDFELNPGSYSIRVSVSREAIEDYVAKSGLPEPVTADERLHYLEMYQPEFKQLALDKLLPGQTSVLITSEDVAH